jgi:hypothetical protein
VPSTAELRRGSPRSRVIDLVHLPDRLDENLISLARRLHRIIGMRVRLGATAPKSRNPVTAGRRVMTTSWLPSWPSATPSAVQVDPRELDRVHGGAAAGLELMYREAGWLERVVRGFRFYRETAPAYGRVTALRGALKDAEYPMAVRREWWR